MSNGLSTMRSALVTALAAALTAYDWQSGTPPTSRVPNDQALGFVWAERVDLDEQNKLLETVTCGVRMYLEYEQQLDPNVPGDPSALEQAAGDLQTTLAPGQYASDPWYYDVVSIELNNDSAYIDAVIRGVRWNDAALS